MWMDAEYLEQRGDLSCSECRNKTDSYWVCCREGPEEARLAEFRVRSQATEKAVLSPSPHSVCFPRLGDGEGFARTTAPCPLV